MQSTAYASQQMNHNKLQYYCTHYTANFSNDLDVNNGTLCSPVEGVAIHGGLIADVTPANTASLISGICHDSSTCVLVQIDLVSTCPGSCFLVDNLIERQRGDLCREPGLLVWAPELRSRHPVTTRGVLRLVKGYLIFT